MPLSWLEALDSCSPEPKAQLQRQELCLAARPSLHQQPWARRALERTSRLAGALALEACHWEASCKAEHPRALEDGKVAKLKAQLDQGSSWLQRCRISGLTSE